MTYRAEQLEEWVGTEDTDDGGILLVLIQKVLDVSFETQMETRDLASVMGSLGDWIPVFEEVKHRLCCREERKRVVGKLKEVNNSAMES